MHKKHTNVLNDKNKELSIEAIHIAVSRVNYFDARHFCWLFVMFCVVCIEEAEMKGRWERA